MIVTQTPLRISFAGGGTDFKDYYENREGFVVSSAIDKYVFVILSKRFDDKIYINYFKKEIVDKVDDIQHELVREAMRITEVDKGIEIVLLSDIPSEGSGLGSSSSFSVGLLNALHIYKGEQVSPAQLAKEACDIEINRCKKPIGKQDQYIAAFGGLREFRFKNCEEVESKRFVLSETQNRDLSNNLFLFYTNQTRKADSILSEQKKQINLNLDSLDKIKDLAFKVSKAVEANDFDSIGNILNENWQLKKELASNISNPYIDEMYEKAVSSGAYGAKICGAGGGGFLLVYCPLKSHQKLREVLKNYQEMPLFLEPDGSKVIFNYRRPSWR